MSKYPKISSNYKNKLDNDHKIVFLDITLLYKHTKFTSWNIDRYNGNYTLINEKGSVLPIHIYIKNNKFHIIDGTHRSTVCKKLNYEYIPVMIHDTYINTLNEMFKTYFFKPKDTDYE